MTTLLQADAPVQGLYYGQFARTEELNTRIAARNIPDRHLENWFTPTPASTKFVRMPVINCNHNTRCKMATLAAPETLPVADPAFAVAGEFAPVTRTAPFRGFSDNVDTESSLRNQFYALQKSDRAVYVPSSNSDLYKVTTAVGRQETQTHPALFDRHELVTAPRPNVDQIGRDMFMNHTRTQLRGV